MITVDEARQVLDAAVRPLPATSVELEAALGHTLSERIVADRDFPPTDRSAMDGFAVRAADLERPGSLKVVGELPAGADPSAISIAPGEACRIFTGAVIPEGADAVVMVEKTVEDREAGVVKIDDTPRTGQHIRSQGKDLHGGDPVLAAGQPIRSAEIAALASVGCVDVPVHGRPRIAVLSTGDEVIAPRDVPAPHQIRDSNAAMLAAQVHEAGFTADVLAHAPDEARGLARRLAEGLAYDLLLITGGVSVGDYDLVASELDSAGVETLFHGVKMKPGKPILAARSACGWVLGLPGNPLSVFVGFKLFGEPLLRRLAGIEKCWPEPVEVTLSTELRRKPGRETYHLCRIEAGVAVPVSSTGSGDVLSLARANGLLITEADRETAPAGTVLRALSF